MFFDEFPKDLKNKIEKENTFVYDGVQFSFNLEKVGLEHRKILMRFHINTFLNMVKQIVDEKFFDGLLLDSNIGLKCYYHQIERVSYESDIYKVGIVGEVTEINKEA